jgi:hypothetical protein
MQEPHTQSGNSPSMNGGKNRTFGAHAPARKRLLCPTGWRALTRGLEERSSESDGTEETDQEEKSWGTSASGTDDRVHGALASRHENQTAGEKRTRTVGRRATHAGEGTKPARRIILRRWQTKSKQPGRADAGTHAAKSTVEK